MNERNRDIFISYSNDGVGQNFAARLDKDLTEIGYYVYFNPNEQGASDFAERLRHAIANCTDFVAIVTEGYLERLYDKEQNWIQKEVSEAHTSGCKITPLLVNGTKMPSDSEIEKLPENLRFFARIDAITMPDSYRTNPFDDLLHKLNALPDRDDFYKYVDNSNLYYRIKPELKEASKVAQSGDPEAIMRVALMYYYGFDGKRDYVEAETRLRCLADEPNAETNPNITAAARNLLAHMYYSGQISQENQSYEKSFEYHERASEHNINSRAELSFAKRFGIGTPFNYESVVQDYCKTVDSNSDMIAHLELGEFYETYGKWKEAAVQYQEIQHTSREAAYRLGMMYKKGVLTDPPFPDFSSAANLLKPLAVGEYPHIEAAYELGMCFARPIGSFPLNFLEAAKYFRIAAEKGHTESAYMLGWIYENELSGTNPQSKANALRYYNIAAENGHALAALQLSQLYQEKTEFTNYHKAYRFAEMAANCGVAEAEMILGNLILFGRGCEPNENCAYRHYSLAAEKGIYTAEVMMKVIEEKIESRKKVDTLVKEARELFRTDTEENWKKCAEIVNEYCDCNGMAANLLGVQYRYGQGVEQSYTKAFEMYKKADALNYRNATWNLADAYYYGLGTEQSYENAAKYYKKAADDLDENDEGDHDAEAIYGQMLRQGNGVTKDLEKAKFYLRKSAVNDRGLAAYECALCYEEDKDFKNALYWFTRAVELHAAGSAKKLGEYYRDGIGIEKPDLDEAEKWFKIADQSGESETVEETLFSIKAKLFNK